MRKSHIKREWEETVFGERWMFGPDPSSINLETGKPINPLESGYFREPDGRLCYVQWHWFSHTPSPPPRKMGPHGRWLGPARTGLHMRQISMSWWIWRDTLTPRRPRMPHNQPPRDAPRSQDGLPCPDCGAVGDLRQAFGTLDDTRLMRDAGNQRNNK
jgi:hypothetical protein